VSAQQSRSAWGTREELDFLMRLGRVAGVEHSKHHDGDTRFKREALLTGYSLGFHKRKNWGRIDRAVILEYLQAQPVGGS